MVGQPVTFTDTTTGPHDQWDWTFPSGNPASSTSQAPEAVTWNVPGTYTVILTTTNNGSASSTQHDIMIGTDRFMTSGKADATPMSDAGGNYLNVGQVDLTPGLWMVEGRASVSGTAVTTADPPSAAVYVRCALLANGTVVDGTVAVVTPTNTGMTIPVLALVSVPAASTRQLVLACGHDEDLQPGHDLTLDAGSVIIATRADSAITAAEPSRITLTAQIPFDLPSAGVWLVRSKAAIINYQTVNASAASQNCHFDGADFDDNDRAAVATGTYGYAVSLAEPITVGGPSSFVMTCDATNADDPQGQPYMDGGAKVVAIRVNYWAEQINNGSVFLTADGAQNDVVTRPIAVGRWLVQARLSLNAQDAQNDRVTCRLRTQNGTVVDSAGVDVKLGSPVRPMLLLATVTNPGSLTVSCGGAGGVGNPAIISPGAKIVATRID